MVSILNKNKYLMILFLAVALVLAACSPAAPAESEPVESEPEEAVQADVRYTLKTATEGSQYLFIGVGGEIDGQVNPDLVANVGDTVVITLVNDDGRSHDIMIDEFNVATPVFGERGREETISFTADEAGTFFYYCSVGNHRRAGMEGQLIVSSGE
jgi:nitrite reductase (NO-forming)